MFSMFLFKIVSYILVLGFCVSTRTLVAADYGLCDGGECVVSPVPNCPENGVFSEQENGCIVAEPLLRSCPEGFKLSRGGTQCSKNVHAEKILTCPENTRYDKHTQRCYVESREVPECAAGYIEDGNGDCYRLKEAEMSCGEEEEEREDGCYSKRLVRKEYSCQEVPPSIRSIHELDSSSFTSSRAFLDGEREYRDDGSRPPVCKVKVLHKPVCPEDSAEDAKGSCVHKSRAEIFCPEGYLMRDVEQEGVVVSVQGGERLTTLESRHYCQREEFVEPISECPGGMVKDKDHSGLDVCYLVKQEVPRQCPMGFAYVEGRGKCVRRELATPRCNPGYAHKEGFCYLQERQVLEVSPVPYCMDPEAVIVGQYCVRNQSMAPRVDCPMGYIFDQADSQCKKNIEIDPITTCPPRFILNPQAQVCERRVEKDCSTTQYKKKCTSFDSETVVDVGREVVVEATSLNAASNHRGGHHHHRHEHVVPRESTKVVHQCVEIPEYIPKMCVNVETAPVVYVCHDGIQSTERKKCIKVSTVMANFSCPREFKLRNNQCEQQSIDSVLYRCSEGYFLSEKPMSKLPRCIPNEEMHKEKKMSALFECPENSELIGNEFNQFECVETKSPICMSENCRSIAKISGPEWRCPAGTQVLVHRDQAATTRVQSERVLVSSHHHPHSTNKIISNIREPPRCVAVVTQPIEKRCSNDRSVLAGDFCLETVEKSCPTGGCESYFEFKPSVDCPENTEPLGLHNADMCAETIRKPFRYHCLTGGKITQHNKCRYIVKKSCKQPNCVQLTPTEGRMECPPGYSEVKIVPNHSSIASSAQESAGSPFQMPNLQIAGAMAQRRKLFGSVRPLSNVGQCAALEFAPFILGCPSGFTQSEGKCVGVMDPSYQCPNGTYMRQDGLCGKPAQTEGGGGDQGGLKHQNQIQYTRKNKF